MVEHFRNWGAEAKRIAQAIRQCSLDAAFRLNGAYLGHHRLDNITFLSQRIIFNLMEMRGLGSVVVALMAENGVAKSSDGWVCRIAIVMRVRKPI